MEPGVEPGVEPGEVPGNTDDVCMALCTETAPVGGLAAAAPKLESQDSPARDR